MPFCSVLLSADPQKKEIHKKKRDVPVSVTQNFSSARNTLLRLASLHDRLSLEDEESIKKMIKEIKEISWRVETCYED